MLMIPAAFLRHVSQTTVCDTCGYRRLGGYRSTATKGVTAAS